MSVRRFSTIVAALSAAALLSHCAVGPDFLVPGAPDVGRYTKEPQPAQTSASDAPTGQAQHFVQGRDIPAQWWRLFKSRPLAALVERALGANPDLQAAMAAIRVAQEAVYAQQGKLLPTVQANFNPTRQKVADNPIGGTSTPTVGTDANGNPVTKNPFNIITAQVQVSYTFDVWGLNRRAVEQLQAQADSQRFQAEAAYLTLTSSVALAAIQEASLRGQIDATNELIAINTKMLDILKRQLDTGYSNRSDVAAQEAALAQVQATLPPLRKALEQNRNLIAALAGGFPSQGPREIFTLAGLQLPRDLPVSLPSKLIEQRPDVRSAEEQLHAASASVGVATANLLPNFTVNANGGYTNLTLAGLVSPANAFWTVAGNVTQPLLDGFTLLHQLRGTQAAYDQAAWQYKSTVISALHNVADVLRALQNDAESLKAAQDFARAAKVSLDLARQQVETGNANVLLLLNAQQTYLQATLQVTQARANRLSDTVALFQALGGGWWNRDEIPTEKVLNVAIGVARPLAEQCKPDYLQVLFQLGCGSEFQTVNWRWPQ